MNKCRTSALATVRVLWAICVLGLTTMAAAAPGIAVGGAFARAIEQASYGGVTFSYDASLVTDVRGQIVPSNGGQDVLVTEKRPEHIGFSFDGYASEGVWIPQIRVIPLAAYKSAHAQSGISAELSSLERYLGGETGGNGPVPYLPPVNAARIITENVVPVAGAGVSGVRFVASYAQGIAPISADNITYMFIGLTADGAYYVEGAFPLSLSTPLDSPPSPVTTENGQAYNRAVAESLSKTDPWDFTPTLDSLDKMMASIKVSRPAIPGMPATGARGRGTARYEGVVFALLALAGILVVVGRQLVWRHLGGPKRCSRL